MPNITSDHNAGSIDFGIRCSQNNLPSKNLQQKHNKATLILDIVRVDPYDKHRQHGCVLGNGFPHRAWVRHK